MKKTKKATREPQSLSAAKGNNAQGYYAQVLEELWHNEQAKEIAEHFSQLEALQGKSLWKISKGQKKAGLPHHWTLAKEYQKEAYQQLKEQRAAEKEAFRKEREDHTGYFSPKKVKERCSTRIRVEFSVGEFSSLESDPHYEDTFWAETSNLLWDVAYELPAHFEESKDLLLKGVRAMKNSAAKRAVRDCLKWLSRALICHEDAQIKAAVLKAETFIRLWKAVFSTMHSACLDWALEDIVKKNAEFQKFCKNFKKEAKKGFRQEWVDLLEMEFGHIYHSAVGKALIEVYPQMEILHEFFLNRG